MSKHTPGPWTLNKRLSASENDKGFDVCDCQHGHYIATVSPWIENERGDASPTGIANARLIAATPALLEACKQAVTEYDLAKVAGFEPRMLVCLEKTAKAARAAIALAESAS